MDGWLIKTMILAKWKVCTAAAYDGGWIHMGANMLPGSGNGIL
jgi:membrane associated rhomboid family serine protease